MSSVESNEMQKGPIKKEKKKYKKRPKIAKECKVCGRTTLFKYYKMQSCDACKHFFRRTICSQRKLICPKANSCTVNKEMKSCRACRLDKCLLEGMDPTMVEAEQSPAQRQFIQSLYKRREFLQQQQQQLQKQNEKEMEIKNEKDTEIKKEKNNNENENGTSDEINEENQTFCQTPDPILSNEFCRSETVPVTGLLHTMPQFVMLEPTNQANFTAVPLSEFPVSFGSSTINSQIVTNIPNNSFSPLFIYYQNNNPLFQFSEEEFLMVSAFVASNSAISGLSDAGRLALQHLSEHYTNTLMNHLRTNHGNMAATLRYAELARQAESLLFSTRLQPTEFYQRRI